MFHLACVGVQVIWRSHRMLTIFDALMLFAYDHVWLRLRRLLTIFDTLIILRTTMSDYVYAGCWRYLTHSLLCVRPCHMTFTQAVGDIWRTHAFSVLPCLMMYTKTVDNIWHTHDFCVRPCLTTFTQAVDDIWHSLFLRTTMSNIYTGCWR